MFAKTEKTEFVIGTLFFHKKICNFGEEELIPDAKKNDFGLFGLAHFHGKVWDIMVGLEQILEEFKKDNLMKLMVA